MSDAQDEMASDLALLADGFWSLVPRYFAARHRWVARDADEALALNVRCPHNENDPDISCGAEVGQPCFDCNDRNPVRSARRLASDAVGFPFNCHVARVRAARG